MIKKSIIGLILACAACCTVPLLIPALAGLSVIGISLFGMKLSLEAVLCGLGLAGLAFVAVYFVVKALRKTATKVSGKSSCAANGGCGCK